MTTAPLNVTNDFLRYARREGIGASVLKLTTTLNKTRMDETSRVLLATPGVYESILLKLLRDKADPKDVEGLRSAVLVAVQDEPRTLFYEQLLKQFRSAEGLSIPDASALHKRFLAAMVSRGVPLGSGKTASAMRSILVEVRSEGDLRNYVDRFAASGEIESSRFTVAVKQSMVDYLEAIGLQRIDDAKFGRGQYDEYFAQAYHNAVFGRNGSPVAVHAAPVPPAAEEFQLPTYDYADEQGIVPASIHAAAVLYQVYFIGDKLGMLEMPNALLARRARGRLDLPSGKVSALLQAYKKFQRAEDVQPEERMMLYRRVFNLGDGNVLDDTVINEQFPALWDSLITEVDTYITKDETTSATEERLSRAAIEEAIRNLQDNLSFYAADIDEDVRVMQQQYAFAEEILRNDQTMASIGLVRRKTLQAAIGRLVSEHGGFTPFVNTMFTLGTSGQKILHFVADFDSSTPEDDFQRFINVTKTWKIAFKALDALGDSDKLDDKESDDFGTSTDSEDEDWES